MQPHQREILDVLNQLQAEGKAPSVALVKRRLPNAVPMRELMETLAYYKTNPLPELPSPSDAPEEKVEQPLPVTTRLTQLEHEVVSLRAEIAELKQCLKLLHR